MAHEIDRLGTVLSGKWRIERKLGEGGMGAVYSAVHVRNAKRVAVKLLHDPASDPDSLARFQREGYAANVIDDPGVVAVYDDGSTDDGAAYLVMELLDGESLEERAERNGGKLGVVEVLSLMHPALAVLAKAHALGVVHRDLKPSNLFLTTASQVKVLDFGLAVVASAPHLRVTTASTPTMGTLGFMPPEQARGEWDRVGPRSDVWALGATMFALLSGLCPHEHGDMSQFLKRALCDAPPALRSVAPHVPLPVAAVVDKALAFDPADRFADAGEMRSAVEAAYQAIAAIQNEVTTETLPPFLGDATLSILDAPSSSDRKPSELPQPIRNGTLKSAPNPLEPMRTGLSLMATSVSGDHARGASEIDSPKSVKKSPIRIVLPALGVALIALSFGIFSLVKSRTSSSGAAGRSVVVSEATGEAPTPKQSSNGVAVDPTPRPTVNVADLPPSVSATATAATSPVAKPRATAGVAPSPSVAVSAAPPVPSAPQPSPPMTSDPGKPDLDRRH